MSVLLKVANQMNKEARRGLNTIAVPKKGFMNKLLGKKKHVKIPSRGGSPMRGAMSAAKKAKKAKKAIGPVKRTHNFSVPKKGFMNKLLGKKTNVKIPSGGGPR